MFVFVEMRVSLRQCLVGMRLLLNRTVKIVGGIILQTNYFAILTLQIKLQTLLKAIDLNRKSEIETFPL